MRTYLGHEIELVPNKAQLKHFIESAGCARFAYNWALSEWKRQYAINMFLKEAEIKPHFRIRENILRKQINAIKEEKFSFLTKVSKCCTQEAIKHLGEAFDNFFAKRSGYPNYRKKHIDDRFSITNDNVQVSGNKVHLPYVGWVKMREMIRFNGSIQMATVKRIADRWFISFNILLDDTKQYFKQHDKNQGAATGIDMGIADLAILSDGTKIENLKPLKELLDDIKFLSRKMAKQKNGSNNWNKTRIQLARKHRRVVNIRLDNMHKATNAITNAFKYIYIETLNIKGMMKNKNLARSIGDVAWGEFKRQIEYKAKLKNGVVYRAPRNYASSKLCSCCGFKNKNLKLSQRTWECDECHTVHDRDVNAAINLQKYAASSVVQTSL